MKRRRENLELPLESAGSPKRGEPVFLAVGKLRRPHGVKGEIHMEVLTDFPGRLRRKKMVFVGEQHEPLVISAIRQQDRALLISFEDLDDCDAVGRLRNCIVYIEAANLPKLPDGEYYYHELLDMTVLDEQGHPLGLLTEILETGANDVYVIQPSQGAEILLPVIDGVILNVDLERREMKVRPPEWS